MEIFPAIRPVSRTGVMRDALAGLTLAAMNVPQALGYTKIAGMPVVTGLYTLLLPLVAYVGGYFWLAQESSVGPSSDRVYRHDWQATAFKPAGCVESTLRGRKVRVRSLRELIEMCKPPSASH